MDNKLSWSTEKRIINDLIPFEKNPRKMTEAQVAQLKKSLEKFNLVEIPAIDTDNIIVAGHQRLKVMQMLERGQEEIDVRVPNRKLTPEEFKEYNVRSNKNTGLWDDELLAGLFNEDELIDIGFNEKELLGLDFGLDEDNKDDKIPEIKEETKSKIGDLYIIGKHRIYCGDSTSLDNVEKLMDGVKADISFTSPPYNVGHNLGYDGKDSKYIHEDNETDYTKLIIDTTNNSLIHAKDVFINLQFLANNKRDILVWLGSMADSFKDIFFWKKSQVAPAMAENVVNSQVECIFLFGSDNNTRSWGNKSFRGDFSNLIETNSASGENKNSKVHNATFPVDLPHKFLMHGYSEGSIVLDLFAGTGTTMIAAEKLGMRCFMMDNEPLYVDIMVKRYCDYVGKYEVIKNGQKIVWEQNKKE